MLNLNITLECIDDIFQTVAVSNKHEFADSYVVPGPFSSTTFKWKLWLFL